MDVKSPVGGGGGGNKRALQQPSCTVLRNLDKTLSLGVIQVKKCWLVMLTLSSSKGKNSRQLNITLELTFSINEHAKV